MVGFLVPGRVQGNRNADARALALRHPANFKNAAQQSRAFSHAQQAHGFTIGDLGASYPPAIVADL
jgi:hypothetical protein